MSLRAEPHNHALSRRLADSNCCLTSEHLLPEPLSGECEWCGNETDVLQEHPRLKILVCAECGKPPEQKTEPPPRFPPKEAWVYFIQAGGKSGPVKIGLADDPAGRTHDFQTGNHLRLRLIGQMRGTLADEAALHRACAEYRIRGEWFRAEVLVALRRNRLWRSLTEAVA